ncbi:MAG: cytochrome c oxidase assembly factor Coa1 family protein [Desulfobacterales bacterium]
MQMQKPPPLPRSLSPKMPTTWWQRNWKWFVPVGCLGLLAIFTGFVVLIVTIVFGMMKSSDVYKEALAAARAEPAVEMALGTPIEEGLFVMGNINISGSSGQADLAIPISGPYDKATIYAAAEKSADRWTFTTLVVEVKTSGERIDLMKKNKTYL